MSRLYFLVSLFEEIDIEVDHVFPTLLKGYHFLIEAK